ncbi:hypothetical protein [Aquabacterium sp.]|uniref:hypothetical protein n=1 Tax=Aquabacterium sp. TaxID=1872578 RepID=UPI0025C53715|nr:hypothetical protein [Aquabacterium sp.]
MSDEPEFTLPRKGSSYFKLIQAFIADLFVAEKRRLDKSIADLIRANNEIKGTQAAGFLYYGEYYTAEGFAVVAGRTAKENLHDSLNSKMEWHIKSAETVATDERLISQIIFRLLDPCQTLQEMRDTLPDCLVEVFPALKKLDRHNDVGITLRGDTRGSRQFDKLLPKIEFYAAARLIY